MITAKSIEEYLSFHPNYSKQINALRKVMTECGLEEALKWGAPAYTYRNVNLIGIAAFKTYCGIWFHRGVFLKDEAKLLINAQEGVTKGLRQWRFNESEKLPLDLIKAYVLETIENEKKGLKVKTEKKVLQIPDELDQAFQNSPQLHEQFQSFTNFKQREFAEYISTAKREETRLKRLAKCVDLINEGVGLNDKYR